MRSVVKSRGGKGLGLGKGGARRARRICHGSGNIFVQ